MSFPVGFRNFNFSVLDLQHVTIVKTGGFSNKNPDTSLHMSVPSKYFSKILESQKWWKLLTSHIGIFIPNNRELKVKSFWAPSLLRRSVVTNLLWLVGSISSTEIGEIRLRWCSLKVSFSRSTRAKAYAYMLAKRYRYLHQRKYWYFKLANRSNPWPV